MQNSQINAIIVDAALPVTVENPDRIQGKRVLIIEDGPTLTHGGMAFGAGTLAAERYGAKEIIDPRPYAIGRLPKPLRNIHTSAASYRLWVMVIRRWKS